MMMTMKKLNSTFKNKYFQLIFFLICEQKYQVNVVDNFNSSPQIFLFSFSLKQTNS